METDLTDHCKAAQMQISSRINKVEEVKSTRTTADSVVEEKERQPGSYPKTLNLPDY